MPKLVWAWGAYDDVTKNPNIDPILAKDFRPSVPTRTLRRTYFWLILSQLSIISIKKFWIDPNHFNGNERKLR